MAEITDRPTRFPDAGYEADVWLDSGRQVDGHSREAREAIAAASLVVFGRTVDQVAGGPRGTGRGGEAPTLAEAAGGVPRPAGEGRPRGCVCHP